MHTNDPIVIVGGFGSHWRDYKPGARALQRISGRRVFVANINRFTWPIANFTSYALLLDITHKAVTEALRETGATRVTLVGHSAGGAIARAYLADDLDGVEPRRAFVGAVKAFHGHERVSRFIALGSPLHVIDNFERQRKPLRYIAWVNQRFPGAYFANVQYLSVYGRASEGKPNGLHHERVAYQYYQYLSGFGNQWGDGVVPNALSRVDGIPSLELEGMSHSPLATSWYLSDEAAIRRWWHYFDVGDAPQLTAQTAVA